MRWKYSLDKEGKELRSLLDKEESTIENISLVYKQIIICLESWKKRLTESDKEDYEYDIDCMIEELQCACPSVDDDSLDYYEEEENLNYYLDEFYDLCDDARVWVGL